MDTEFSIESAGNNVTLSYYRDILPVIQKWTSEPFYNDLYLSIYNLSAGFDYKWIESGQKLPKRIYHAYYERTKKNLPQEVKSELGGMLGKLATSVSSSRFHIARFFNWNAGDFEDSGSCYWQSRFNARISMDMNPACHSIRIYSNDKGIGRCWLKETSAGWIIWNAYGKYELNQIAKILSDQFNKSYYEISLRNRGSANSTIYINGGTGYLISDNPPDSHCYNLEIDLYATCHQCGTVESVDQSYEEEEFLCSDCDDSHICGRCGSHFTDGINIGDNWYCDSDCARRDGYYQCYHCDTWLHVESDSIIEIDYHTYCEECANELYNQCPECGDYHNDTDFKYKGSFYCSRSCVRSAGLTLCEECEDVIGPDESMVLDATYCHECGLNHLPDNTCKVCLQEHDYIIYPAQECVECHSAVVRKEQGIVQLDFISNDHVIDANTGEVLSI